MERAGASKVTKGDVDKFRDSLLKLHEKIIDVSGGHQGVRDIGGFEHALYEIITCSENHGCDRPLLVASKAYSLLANRHYFVDGNKRTSHIVAKLILLEYGHVFRPKYEKAIDFIMQISRGEKSLAEIENWISQNSCKIESLDGYFSELANDIEDMRKYMNSQS